MTVISITKANIDALICVSCKASRKGKRKVKSILLGWKGTPSPFSASDFDHGRSKTIGFVFLGGRQNLFSTHTHKR